MRRDRNVGNQSETILANKAPGQSDRDDKEDLQVNAKLGFDVSDSRSGVLNVVYVDQNRDEVMLRQQSQADGSGVQFGALAGQDTLTTKPHDVFTDNGNRFEPEHTIIGLALNWERESFAVKTITACQKMDSATWTDFDGTANRLFAFAFNGTTEFDTYTQEIQLTSKISGDSRQKIAKNDKDQR
ncbi:MAG: hypothetical protein OXC05_02990 [Halieaceae bacterium]|nr:hypothetical protein [Halieaceae bacterium]